MQTINQAGDPLADYDSRVRRWQQTGREDGFEDDATASLPSRVMVDALGPERELGVVGVARMIVRAVGYCLVFVMYGLMGGIVALVAEGMSPHGQMPAAFWFIWPVAIGVFGVVVQYRINRRRRVRSQSGWPSRLRR